jgi:integrase
MWINNILGEDNPHHLVHTMIYLLGMNLILRGRLEHRQLQWDNFELHENVIVYREHASKCNVGGIKGRQFKGKVVYIYANPAVPLRCPVRLFKKYASLCPPDREPNSPFYLKKFSNTLGYSKVPLSLNTIAKATSSLMQRTNVEGFFTNHSLRRSAITRLYNEGIDEKRICETSGHRSTAVSEYEMTGENMRQEISQAIQGITPAPLLVPITATTTAPITASTTASTTVPITAPTGCPNSSATRQY